MAAESESKRERREGQSKINPIPELCAREFSNTDVCDKTRQF